MTLTARQTFRLVIDERPPAEPLGAHRRAALLTSLLEAGYSVTVLGVGASVASPLHTLRIGRFTRSEIDESTDRCIDIEHLDTAEVLAAVDEAARSTGTSPNRPGQWKPWFPVIDYDRCTNCMQCLSFCLFDVYGVDSGGTLRVSHQDHCKTDCPACSRVCPELAIVFPKHQSGPINGAPVSEADAQREPVKVDISALLGGDLYGRLRDRHQQARQRFARQRDEKKGLSERMRCLRKLQEGMDVPMSALTSLPSPEEIQRRAAAAQAKAEDARSLQNNREGGPPA